MTQIHESQSETSPTQTWARGMRLLLNAIGMLITWAAWLGLVASELEVYAYMLIAVFGTLAVIPMVYLGRWLLDRQPGIMRAEWVTTGVHYLVAILFGSALISATRLGLGTLSGEYQERLPLQIPTWLGVVIMLLSGAALLLVIFNLVLKGIGLPFAVSLTQVVVTDWIYAWTRNPMVLSALAFLVGLGLWLQSGLFLIWVLVIVSPALLVAMKVYEERELEIRFGQDYQEYKSRTPMLWPRRPKKE